MADSLVFAQPLCRQWWCCWLGWLELLPALPLSPLLAHPARNSDPTKTIRTAAAPKVILREMFLVFIRSILSALFW
jgi:hypothetical protein